MSLFNKVLASIGIGSAQVDTQLEKTSYTAGETVRGIVVIQGGKTEQAVDSINLSLKTKYITEVNDSKVYLDGIISSFKLTEPLTIQANERKEIPFNFQLPYNTPITVGKNQVWIHTGLDISMAADPTDNDYITVQPAPIAQSVLSAVQSLGFQLIKVENEKSSRRFGTSAAFLQEFEYRPTGTFRSYLDELEVTFIHQSANEVTFVMQVDRRARGLSGLFSEALEMDETFVRVTVTQQDIHNMRSIIENEIRRYMK